MATEPAQASSNRRDRLRERFYRQSYLVRWVGLPMVAASAVFFVLSLLLGGWLEGVLVDLAVTCLGVLLTVFFVERVLARENEIRWLRVRKIATHQIKSAVTSSLRLFTWFDPDKDRWDATFVPMGYLRGDPLGFQKYYYDNPTWRAEMLTLAADVIEARPYEFGQEIGDEMPRLIQTLSRSRSNLQEVVQLYGSRLSATQTEQIWTFQRLCGEIEGLAPSFERGNEESTWRLPYHLATLIRLGICLIEENGECDVGAVSITPRP